MVRQGFYVFTFISLLLIAFIYPFWPPVGYFLIVVLPIIALGFYDLNTSHNILRNYPVIGHIRYMFEFVRPEIQQYFVATNLSGRPYNRETRSLIYERAKGLEDAHPFGTEHDILETNYEFAHHSIATKEIKTADERIKIGGKDCQQPYSASRLNISAMSFGALGATAVRALNRGAKLGGFYQNTGEGGLTQYHLEEGGDIVWQLGTAYFGCRTSDGDFDAEQFKAKASHPHVKMIEIKISQGAKPSHGGLLPAAKITAEIAKIRGIPMGKDCYSPPGHKQFSTPLELMDFITKLRELTEGKPIGFKLCIGKRNEFMGICKAMLETGVLPDFITIDGAEGGTGAAPLEYTNRLGLPINEGIAFVHNCLVGVKLRDKIHLIASGKVANGFDMVSKIALGADMCNIARPMLFALGCIQALRCHTNTCPTGITTQNPARYRAVVPKEKAAHVFNLHKNTLRSFLDLTGAMGADHPDKLDPSMIYKRISEGSSISFSELLDYLKPGALLGEKIPTEFKSCWEKASAEHF